MNVKILIWGFSGVKYLKKDKEAPTKDDFKYATITTTDKRYICAREFDELKNQTIKITNTYKWGNLTGFDYDNYRCIIETKNYKEIK